MDHTMTHRMTLCWLTAAVVVTAATLLPRPMQAQSDYSDRGARAMLSVGPFYTAGASMTFDAPQNYKVAPVFAWRTGIDVSYPLTPVIGATLGLGLDVRGNKMYWYSDETVWEQRRITYFTVSPAFTFSAFYLGFTFGFPTAGGKIWQNTTDAPERTLELNITENNLNVMLEPRIGVVIPLVDAKIGWLGLSVLASYNLSTITDDKNFFAGQSGNAEVNSNAVSLQGGITWQFGIPGTGR